MTPPSIAIADLLDRHDGVLLDVYGVLLDARGALPGARELIAELARRAMPYAIVTNDASRSAATYERRFAALGLAIAAEHVVTSGSLLPAYLRAHVAPGAAIAVLGTEDSRAYVRAGGGVPVPLAAGMVIDALAICDDDGYDFLPGIEHALSAVVRAIDAGRAPALVLPNPDLVYPKGDGELGFTAGAIALLIEAALARRFPERAPAFDRLGKPAPHLFRAAADMLGIAPDRLVMIGDQLETDVVGARAAGIPAALLAGVSRWHEAHDAELAPSYLLARLAP
ncbi:MAG TPA: HAD hydrolase-like protein [Kofleriaceae bacterium]|nr:HAD hydrolase-like protein [Kofleriaceae bacterium]